MGEIVWSDEQLRIFDEARLGRSNVVIRARAGTGKTTSIEELVRRAPERDILVCAFNKRIAEEAQKRMPSRVQVKTLHSLGCKFMFRGWDRVRLDEDRGLRLASEAAGPGAPQAFIKLVAKLASLGKGACPEKDDRALLDLAYEHDVLPEEEWEELGWTLARMVDCAVVAMAKALVRDGTYDFDDMVFVPVANGWVRPTYDLVVVDEAQDMNKSQLILARKIVRPRGRVFVVGDDRQAIYAWRGADPGAIDRMKAELKAVELSLTITRRCPKRVVAEAALIVPDFRASPDAPEGSVEDIREEKMFSLARPGECFVLSRANAPLASVAMRFLREGVPCRIQGKDIGQALAALALRLAGKRTLPVASLFEKLQRWLEVELGKADALEKAGKASLADRRRTYVTDQHDTLVALSDGLATAGELVARLESLFADTGRASVVCSSVHRSKGLEMDDVFLLDWTFRGGSEEEENIRYVALTRARRRLFNVRQGSSGRDEPPPRRLEDSTGLYPRKLAYDPVAATQARELCEHLDSVADKHHGHGSLAEAFPDPDFMFRSTGVDDDIPF